MKVANRRIVTFTSIAVVIGVFWGRFAIDELIYSIVLPLVLVASGILFTIFTKKKTFFVILLAISVGFFASVMDGNFNSGQEINGEYELTARVSEIRSNSVILDEITLNGENVEGKGLYRTNVDYSVGVSLTFTAEVTTMDVDMLDTYSSSYYCDEIYYEVYSESEVVSSMQNLTLAEKIKAKITLVALKYTSQENVGILNSLLFGDKTYLDETDKTAINGIGLAHIFAVSGLHVGFLAWIITKLFKKLRINRVISLAVTIVVMIAYASLTGYVSGVKRAGIMLVVGAIGSITARKNDGLTTLSLSAMIITLTNPRELFDIGFIMSFSAVLGTLCFYRPIYRILTKYQKNKVFVYFAKILATTISANIFIFPILSNVFESVSLYAPIANMLILPIISVVFPVAFIVGTLALIWQGFGVFFLPLGIAVDFIRLLSTSIYSLPYSSLPIPPIEIVTFFYVLAFLILSPYVVIKPKYKYASFGVLGSVAVILAIVL